MSNTIRFTLFKEGSQDFKALLSEHSVPQKIRRHDPGSIVAVGEIIEVAKAIGVASIIPAIATVIVQWLKNRGSRKIMIQTDDNRVVSLEGDVDQEQLEVLLKIAKSGNVIQTTPDKEKS